LLAQVTKTKIRRSFVHVLPDTEHRRSRAARLQVVRAGFGIRGKIEPVSLPERAIGAESGARRAGEHRCAGGGIDELEGCNSGRRKTSPYRNFNAGRQIPELVDPDMRF